MRTLESILDKEFDVGDEVIIPEDLISSIFGKNAVLDLKVRNNTAFISSDSSVSMTITKIERLKEYGVDQINISFPKIKYLCIRGAEHMSNVSIECGDKIVFEDLIGEIDWYNVQINALRFIFSPWTSSEILPVKMKKVKIKSDVKDPFGRGGAMVFNCPSTFSIDITCKFENIRWLCMTEVAGRLSKAYDRLDPKRLAKYNPGDVVDVEYFWNINPWKIFHLNPKKWPDLGKICINKSLVSCAYSIVLYRPDKGIIPLSQAASEIAEYSDGWKGILSWDFYHEVPHVLM